MTPYQRFCEKWQGGCGSGLCEKARRVYARGRIPCDVLFVGEAPGESENVLGVPFAGPAGFLLDRIVAQSIGEVHYPITVGFANLVCCIPRESDGNKAAEPDDKEIKACGPRLVEFINLCKPRLIVCVGAMARDWLDPKVRPRVDIPKEIPQVDITHPAAILRANTASQGMLVRRCILTVRNAVDQYVV